MRIEVCVDAVAGVRIARDGGADRVELCSALEVGGLTPSAGLIRAAVAIGLPVHVLVRCRPGDFVFSEDEIAVMIDDVAAAAAAGAAGVVVGALTQDGGVDTSATGRLIAAAGSASTTFHRAFDLTRDPFAAFGALRTLGVDRVLTSGQAASAPEGASLLAALVRRSGVEGPVILAGGGVRPESVGALVAATGVTEVHFSARVPIVGRHGAGGNVAGGRGAGGKGTGGKGAVTMGLADDGGRYVTDPALVAATVRAACVIAGVDG